mmetsp:Transcript_60708/g.170085  ORF Transcript_60708/g.170085 Transcript_60708/m.170085 type:complete len:262 (+) Transcript_60708:245-1030(+)
MGFGSGVRALLATSCVRLRVCALGQDQHEQHGLCVRQLRRRCRRRGRLRGHGRPGVAHRLELAPHEVDARARPGPRAQPRALRAAGGRVGCGPRTSPLRRGRSGDLEHGLACCGPLRKRSDPQRRRRRLGRGLGEFRRLRCRGRGTHGVLVDARQGYCRVVATTARARAHAAALGRGGNIALHRSGGEAATTGSRGHRAMRAQHAGIRRMQPRGQRLAEEVALRAGAAGRGGPARGEGPEARGAAPGAEALPPLLRSGGRG